MKKSRQLCGVAFILIISLLLTCPWISVAIAESAPFTISIEPKEMTANVGEEVTYSMSITAEEGFNEPIYFELDISALGYQVTLDVGQQDPPYPKDFEYSFTLPSEIPIEVTSEGVMTATSGDYVVQETVEITIKQSGGAGGIIGWLIQMLAEFWNRIISIFQR